MVSERDLGNNFFVTVEDLGKPKSKVLLDNLLELNPEDVKGEAVIKTPDAFMAENADQI